MPALYLAFGRTGIQPENEEVEEIRGALTAADKNGSLHHLEPQLAAASTPGLSADCR
jgi:hypothetical protein